MTLPTKPVASAILAVYNSAATLPDCLDSLLAQSAPLEIIAIDDGSTDNTLKILQKYKKNIKIYQQSHTGPATARNLGAKEAATDILLFVDADMTFDKHYVRDLIKPIQLTKVVGTYTSEERVANWDSQWARCWNWQEGWTDRKRFSKNPPQWGTDFRAILKADFLSVGGFDNTGYTDTWTLFQKLGTKPLRTKAICYHYNPATLNQVFRQARWVAKRPYRYGALGTLYALLRTSLPVSLLVGITKSLSHHNLRFLVFKLVYDFGRFAGIFEMLVVGKLSK